MLCFALELKQTKLCTFEGRFKADDKSSWFETDPCHNWTEEHLIPYSRPPTIQSTFPLMFEQCSNTENYFWHQWWPISRIHISIVVFLILCIIPASQASHPHRLVSESPSRYSNEGLPLPKEVQVVLISPTPRIDWFVCLFVPPKKTLWVKSGYAICIMQGAHSCTNKIV